MVAFLTVLRLANGLADDFSFRTIRSSSFTYIWFEADLDGTSNENPRPDKIDLAMSRMARSMELVTEVASRSETSRQVVARSRSVRVRALEELGFWDWERSLWRAARISESGRSWALSAWACEEAFVVLGSLDFLPAVAVAAAVGRRRFFSDIFGCFFFG